MKSLSHARLFVTPWVVVCTKLLCPWDFQGKSTGVGSHFLLQGIFPTQGSNPGLSHCRQMLYCLSQQKYKPNNQETGLPPHSALPIRGKTNKQANKNSAQISPYAKVTQTIVPTLGGKKPKGRKNSTFLKERIQPSSKPGIRRLQT